MTDQHDTDDAEDHRVARASNQAIHTENMGRLERYLNAADVVPGRNGVANISAIAIGAELDRQFLYCDEARALIAEIVARKGLGIPNQQRVPTEEVPAWAVRRIQELEQQLTIAKTELVECRTQIRRYQHLESHLSETGLLPR